MALTLILAAVVIIVLSVYYYFKNWNNYWRNKGVNGPKPHFLYGNFKDLILRRVTSFEVEEEIYNNYPKEKVVGLYRFHTPVLLLRDLDIIQHVFIREFDNFVNRGVEFGGRLSDNLASSKDETWRLLRTRLSPIFTSGKLKNMLYLMERCGDETLNYLASFVSQTNDHDILDIAQKYTLGSISACAFGLDMDIKNLDVKLMKIEKMLLTQFKALELFYICPGLLHRFGISAMPTVIADFFSNLVDIINKQRNGVPSGRKDFMDLLLDMKNSAEIKGGQRNEGDDIKVLQITDELIAAQAMIFYAAGFETSATTIAFLLYEIAKNQDVQEKLVQEITGVLEKNNGELNLDTLKQMTYLDQVFDETLRMYPIADLQRKVSVESCKLPGTDITLKRDDFLYVSARGIHYDENYYPDPHKFDPERFSPENVKARHPCAYMPFGLGPRHCIGIRFAKVQSRIFLIKFLRDYKVEPASVAKKFEYDPMKLTLAVKGGVPLRIIKRK